MEAKSQEKRRLDALPESGDKFWEHSDYHKVEVRYKPKCEHYFIRKSGREVECQKCGAGLFISAPWHIEKGHLYKSSQKVL